MFAAAGFQKFWINILFDIQAYFFSHFYEIADYSNHEISKNYHFCNSSAIGRYSCESTSHWLPSSNCNRQHKINIIYGTPGQCQCTVFNLLQAELGIGKVFVVPITYIMIMVSLFR